MKFSIKYNIDENFQQSGGIFHNPFPLIFASLHKIICTLTSKNLMFCETLNLLFDYNLAYFSFILLLIFLYCHMQRTLNHILSDIDFFYANTKLLKLLITTTYTYRFKLINYLICYWSLKFQPFTENCFQYFWFNYMNSK